MISKLAYSFSLNVLIFFFFWLCMAVFLEHTIFCINFCLYYLKCHAFVNPSFKPVCFKDQEGPPTQIMFFKCNITTGKERPLSIHLRP